MKIEVQSDNPLTKYHLKNIQDEIIDFKFGDEVSLPAGWYELNIEYTGKKTLINAIILNDEDIKHLMYIGWYVDKAGKRHQPGNAVWDYGGCFKIWLHTDVGVFRERIIRSIINGDFGSDMTENYLFTCDKPIEIHTSFPKNLQSFFRASDGPNWWHKKSLSLPYWPTPDIDVDKNEIIKECTALCVHRKNDLYAYTKEWKVLFADEKTSFEMPFIDLDTKKFPHLKKMMDSVGIEKALNIGFYALSPGGYVDMHIDDKAYKRKGYRYLKRCKTFYWSLTDTKDVLFKFGRCGILPLDGPLFINPVSHVHSVVNQSQNERWVVSIVGKYVDED